MCFECPCCANLCTNSAQVAEACAFGVPDSKYGEIVGAVIVPKAPVADAAAFAKDVQAHAAKKLASFKVCCRVVAFSFFFIER